MNSVASAVSRILNQHIAVAGRGLLWTSCMATSATLLLCTSSPALADCQPVQNSTCSAGGTGSIGTDAPGPGENGGDGGEGPNSNVDTTGFTLHFVDTPSSTPDGVPTSPINIQSAGGVGAQGADGHLTGGGKAAGGNGGKGGDSGDLSATVVSTVSGTTNSNASGITLGSNGGTGGEGAYGALNHDPGVGGNGGNGGHITASLAGNFPDNLNNHARAVAVWSDGGDGGAGRSWSTLQAPQAPAGGVAGNGGQIDLTLNGTFIGDTGGVSAKSVGGNGGKGGDGEATDGSQSGEGGQGGNGSAVNVTVNSNSNIQGFANQDAGLIAQSVGGTGGQGGSGGGSGGKAGAGGNAGNVTVTVNGGYIENGAGSGSAGLLAQSLGGNGGGGGVPSQFVIGPNGGSGTTGGTAGTVSVTTGNGGGVVTIVSGQKNLEPGDYSLSPGVLAQSIGGGGGAGSDAKGWFAVGGDGGNGVNGNTATVDLAAKITTYGINSDGIAVQSIGGGGGKGGDAQGSGVEVQMVIGGTGGGGGDGSDASAQLRAGSVIETDGAHSSGMLIQSVGGGGGMGGAAYSKSTNAFYGADMSVGGDGGAGGNGGTVGLVDGASATNAGQISTLGADSYGIIGQSIGGGGGIGGASTAESKTYSGGDAPGLSLTMALGGTGGTGGSAGSVTLVNAGLITTTGAGSVGILGQSIGGGGGAGGDASSSSTASGGNMNLSANFTLGGSGGVAGNGGIANITNSGLIVTTGESAAGMLVQSIGGGGGTGGSGDAKSSANGKDISLTMALGSGGHGGSGGDGYAVTATNNASIITLGDSAFGIGAQSIGGAGGTGGGAAASATGDISASLIIGGAGGAGGSAYHVDGNGRETGIVTVNNSKNATIVTFGADSNGIIAQSIGGGGGAGGKAATSLSTKKSTGDGGNGDATGTQNTFQTLASAFAANGLAGLSQYGGMNGAINAVNSLLNPPSSGVKASSVADDGIDSELDSTAQSKGTADDDNESPSIHLQVALGGQGGGGGTGGAVVVNNDGEIATMGHDADAILAQSIGGGGGKGGAATTATSNQNSGSLSVGGNGGGGGYGDDVSVNNTGAIYTKGALAAGIVAESISGGGGIGGASASSISSSSKNAGNGTASDGELSSISMTLGGNGGTTFDSGEVNVLSSGAISTAAHDAIGIIAQSISGGGGIVKSIATDQEGAGGAASANETEYAIQLKFGGASSVGSSGYGSGYVNVATLAGGSITTQGANSYGILVQSIAGGGGVALGGNPKGSTVEDWFGTGAKTGSVLAGGVSGLFVNVGDNITTSGNGAIGILAQSIGGGGGLAGDTEASATPVDFVHGNTSSQFTGSGGVIGVVVGQGSTVSTSGTNAPALFLQSIGGGGGRITTANGVYMGTAGGTGQGGAINVTVNGTVLATGPGSAGIVAQSEGGNEPNGTPNSSPITITVGSTGKISAGLPTVETSPNMESAAIFIDHGGLDSAHPNTVINNGQIVSYGTLVNSVAIWSSAGYTQVYNNAGASMSGDVLLTNDGGSGCFSTYGTFASGNTVTVGKCPVINGGTINIGGAGVVGKTTISGDYVQLAAGTLNIDADLNGGKADTLAVTGKATVSGTINVNAMTVSNKPVTVLTASGGVSVDPQLKQTDHSALFDFPVVASGNQLEIQPTAHFSDAAANLNQNQKKMAAYLQQLFNSGASLDDGFTALSKISLGDVDRDYGASLRSMSGEALGAFGAFRVNSSRAFVDNLYQGCRDLTFERNTNESCSWARISGGSADQSARGDTVGYQASAYTVEVGGQVGLSDKLALVGSLGSEQSQFSGDDNDTSQIKGSAAVLGVGLNYADGPWELAGALDGAYGWYRSYRMITVGEQSQSADATPRQWQLGAHVKGGYEIDFASSTYVKPFVEAHVIRVTNNSFTEDGNSPFRLSVDGRSDTSLVAGTGVELGAHIQTRFGAELHPFISAAAEFGQDVQWTSTAHFAEQPTGPGFETQTAGPGTVGRFTVGADLVNLKNLSFSLLYSPEVGSGYHSQQGTARISYTF
jgi:hypothetical protein